MIKKRVYKKGAMALSQILILVLGTIAFTYVIGIGQVQFVKADTTCSGSGQIGTTNTFCYGGSVYTVIDSLHVTRNSDGRGYINQGGSWYWQSSNGNVLLGPNTGDTQSTFAAGASAAMSGLTPSNPNSAPASSALTCNIDTDCGSSQTCISGLCFELSGYRNGIACGNGNNQVCDSGYCSPDTHLCADRPSTTTLSDGSPCVSPGSSDPGCISGYCDATAHCAPAPAASPPASSTPNPANGVPDLAPLASALNLTQSNTQCPCTEGFSCVGGACVQNAPFDPTKNVPENTPTPETDWKAIGDKIVSGITALVVNAGIAAAVYIGAGFIKTNLLGIKPGDPWNYAATGAQFILTGAVFGALEVPSLMTTLGVSAASAGFWGSALGGGIIGAAIALVAFLALYKTTKTNAVIVSCVPWQAPTGGNDCDKCGQNGLTCTAYQCASLGQACKLENSQSGQGKPICVWVDSHDITPPTITFLSTVLPTGYTYSPLNAQYPGDTGVLIQSPNGNIPAYSALTFGVTTDKASKCKIDLTRQDNYANMSFMMFGGIDGSEGQVGYNHTISLPIFQPSPSVAVQKSGQVDVFIRCQNANGYSDPAAFDVQFVVDTTPDKTPPQIIGTSIMNGAPVPFGTGFTSVGVYVNEPVSLCRWSHSSTDFNSMENSMTCANVMNTAGLYAGTFTCNANLNGLKSGVENDFYFACNDTSGNMDTQAYKYVLMGTQSLVINSVTPSNGTLIKDSTQSVKVVLGVQTNAGQNQGQATCYYSPTGSSSDYLLFSSTASYQSAQDLWLPSGAYTYYIKCVDLGGNAAYSSVHFNVQTDTQSPEVVRATHDGANLDIQTNEKATCVYDIVDCTYPAEDGTSMSTTDGLTHSTSWVAGRTYYIKCTDSFGNQPAPSSCSIVLSPSQI